MFCLFVFFRVREPSFKKSSVFKCTLLSVAESKKKLRAVKAEKHLLFESAGGWGGGCFCRQSEENKKPAEALRQQQIF